MSTAPDLQLQRALTALRALEPPSNGFEARLRGALLRAADPALSRRASAPARPAPARQVPVRLWRTRPLAALSLAALSLAGIAAAVSGRGWLWQRSEVGGAPALSAEPARVPAARAASSEQIPDREVPKVLELPPDHERAPRSLAVPQQAERVSVPEPVRPRRKPPASDPSFSSASVLPMLEPERVPVPVVVPRFDLPDLPAHGADRGSAARNERSERREDRVPSPDGRSRTLDRVSETRDRAVERRPLDRPRPSLDPAALDRDRRGPPEVRDREREQPEPRESEGGRGRR